MTAPTRAELEAARIAARWTLRVRASLEVAQDLIPDSPLAPDRHRDERAAVHKAFCYWDKESDTQLDAYGAACQALGRAEGTPAPALPADVPRPDVEGLREAATYVLIWSEYSVEQDSAKVRLALCDYVLDLEAEIRRHHADFEAMEAKLLEAREEGWALGRCMCGSVRQAMAGETALPRLDIFCVVCDGGERYPGLGRPNRKPLPGTRGDATQASGDWGQALGGRT